MKPEIVLKHEFVEFIPGDLKAGTIYISLRFGTASHLCCCGCGNKVVTPIRPTDWTLLFDGKTISLDPSIGNWSFACQSHYWIKNNKVRWADQWSKQRIETGKRHDRFAKARYFGSETEAAVDTKPAEVKTAWWCKLKNWWKGS